MNDFITRFGPSKNRTPQVLTGLRDIESQSMNAANALTPERRHPLEYKVAPPMVVVLIGAAMAVIARFTPAIEIESSVRFVSGGIDIALGALVVVQDRQGRHIRKWRSGGLADRANNRMFEG